jgi:hypothetical protein
MSTHPFNISALKETAPALLGTRLASPLRDGLPVADCFCVGMLGKFTDGVALYGCRPIL